MKRYQYAILSVGAILTFLGHGLWAVTKLNPKFPDLLTGSFHTFGVSVSTHTATNMVQVIGSFDLTVTAIMIVLLVGYIQGYGTLYRLAVSKFAVGVYVYATVWAFLTALSRPLSEGFWPASLDLVERGANWQIALALLVATVVIRRRVIA